jgi:hypothetical protein
MTTLEILEQAYTLLDERHRWTAGALARSRDGEAVAPCLPSAVQWCGHGAIERVACPHGHSHRTSAFHVLLESCRILYKQDIAPTNDSLDGYRRIRSAYRYAIREERERVAA